MTTTAGSHALEGSIPSTDSGIAEKLRAAGAILLAKTNLSEWANFRSTHSSSGWSEPTLLRLAFAFEQQTKARLQPAFRETLAG